jgi:hypothetical protein
MGMTLIPSWPYDEGENFYHSPKQIGKRVSSDDKSTFGGYHEQGITT